MPSTYHTQVSACVCTLSFGGEVWPYSSVSIDESYHGPQIRSLLVSVPDLSASWIHRGPETQCTLSSTRHPLTVLRGLALKLDPATNPITALVLDPAAPLLARVGSCRSPGFMGHNIAEPHGGSAAGLISSWAGTPSLAWPQIIDQGFKAGLICICTLLLGGSIGPVT